LNDKYRRLKQKYDDISKRISDLHAEQRNIRELMEQACTHENLLKVDAEPFLVDIYVEDEEAKFKCADCYRYFAKGELQNK
jgi:hypothetical protein